MSDDGGRAAPAPRTTGAPVTPPPLEAALPWRRWPDAVSEAAAHGRPLLVLVEAAWTTAAQRLAWCVHQDDDLRAACESMWVPCHVDPWTEPAVATWLRFEAAAITGEPGPPLLVMLDDAAEPFMAFGTLAYEGDVGIPSLLSLLRAGEALHRTERARLRDEAAARRGERRFEAASAGAPTNLEQLARSIVDHGDPLHGGLKGATKEPLPHALLALLDVVELGGDAAVTRHLERTLEGLATGGIRDQLWRGFHRAARDDRWVVPHFEKIVPANAALATVFARAGRLFERRDWIEVAEETLWWTTMALESGVDAIEADTGYYTWTPQEVRRVVTPDVLQVLGFHFHLTPNASRHVLYQAVAPAELHAYAHEPQETLLSRLELGREQLLQARHARRSPMTHASPRACWRADALVMALVCAEELAQDPERLLAIAETVSDGAEDPAAPQTTPRWFEDRAALAHLMAAVAHSTGRTGWRERADAIVDHMLTDWPRVGNAFVLRVPQGSDAMTSGYAVLDAATASPVSHVLAALRRLRPDAVDTRRDIAAAHVATAAVDQPRAASFWREALTPV